jgi:hypothetical protein
LKSELFAILGSGFGLYGYLPALIRGCGRRVVLPDRYRGKFFARPELERFSASVEWASSEEESLRLAAGAALALRPSDQELWLPTCAALPRLRGLLLEKPLARNPDLAQRALDALTRSKKDFRIGYLFGVTAWGEQVQNFLGTRPREGKLSIRWQFCAHHYQKNLDVWKRDADAGGGAIRFFGIHLIALLAAIGYRQFLYSRTFGCANNDLEAWHAVATGRGVPECEIAIETRSTTTAFDLMYRPPAGPVELHHQLAGPFDSGQQGDANDGLDPRTVHLTKLCRSLSEPSGHYNNWYQDTLNLWREAETRAEFTLRPPPVGNPPRGIPST